MKTGRRPVPVAQLEDALRWAAIELEDVPALEAYKLLRKDRHQSWPSHMTIIRRFGGWNKALEAVGLVPSKRWRTQKSIQRSRLWTPDIRWLAGWLEGEGSFRAQVERDKYARFHIVAHTVDEDIARRAEKIAGYVSGPYGPYTDNRQPYWVWQEKQRDKVFELVRALYPLMGKRRRKQMNMMLSVSKEFPVKYTGTMTVRRPRGV